MANCYYCGRSDKLVDLVLFYFAKGIHEKCKDGDDCYFEVDAQLKEEEKLRTEEYTSLDAPWWEHR